MGQVGIIAVVRRADAAEQIVLVTQFRPPTNQTCIEFPAGLVDRGETVEEAALRELKEETGFTGEVEGVTPVLFGDPGMSNANLRLVHVSVDGDRACNRDPIPEPEEGEEITPLLAPAGAALKGYLDQMCSDRGVAVDARLYAFACGLAQRTAGGAEARVKLTGASSCRAEDMNEINMQGLVWLAAALCLAGAAAAALFRNF